MAKVEILRRTEVPSIDPTRVSKRDLLILYRLDGDPAKSDTVILPAEAAADAQVLAAIKRKEDEKAKQPRPSLEI